MSTSHVIARMLGGGILSIPIAFVDMVGGDLCDAVILSQILYWWDRNGNKPFPMTQKQWRAIGIKRSKLERGTRQLEDLGFIETSVRKDGNTPKTWYAICDTLGDEFAHRATSKNATPIFGLAENNNSDLLKSTSGNVEINKSMEMLKSTNPSYKEEEDNTEEMASPVLRLARFFADTVVTIAPHPSTEAWQQKWAFPLQKFLEACSGDVSETQEKMGQAISYAREKGYTVVTPHSIINMFNKVGDTQATVAPEFF